MSDGLSGSTPPQWFVEFEARFSLSVSGLRSEVQGALDAVERAVDTVRSDVSDVASRTAVLEKELADLRSERSGNKLAAPSSDPKMEALSRYSGVGKELARIFIQQCETYAEYYSFPTERRFILFVISRLEGSAALWASPMAQALPLLPTEIVPEATQWTAFRLSFLQTFGDLIPTATATENIRVMRQKGRSISDYVSELRSYRSCLPADERSSMFVKSCFEAGLDRKVAEALLRCPGTDTLDGLIRELLLLEPAMARLHARESGKSAPTAPTAPVASSLPRAPPKDPSAMDVDKVRILAAKVCGRCGGKGHSAEENGTCATSKMVAKALRTEAPEEKGAGFV